MAYNYPKEGKKNHDKKKDTNEERSLNKQTNPDELQQQQQEQEKVFEQVNETVKQGKQMFHLLKIVPTLVWYTMFGFTFYKYSTFPEYYGQKTQFILGDSCSSLQSWGVSYAIFCFAFIAERILLYIPFIIFPELLNQSVQQMRSFSNNVEIILTCIFFFAFHIILLFGVPCGNLSILTLVSVILGWIFIPLFCCCGDCLAGCFAGFFAIKLQSRKWKDL